MSALTRREGFATWLGRLAGLGWLLVIGFSASNLRAQDGLRLEAIDVQPLPGEQVELRLRLNGSAPEPMTFTIDDPARISLDLPNTALALDSRRQEANVGPVTTILAAEANGRTRIVLNLSEMVPYDTRVAGNEVIVRVGRAPGGAQAPAFSAQPAPSAGGARPAAAVAGERSIRNIDFRRGADGSGQIVVELSDPRTTVDVRTEGGRLVVDFQNTTLPADLMRRLDVTDFATPVYTVDALRSNRDARLVVSSAPDYDQVAYQSDNQFTLELKPPVEQASAQPGVFDPDREYTGERLTLNFQDLETRAVLQLIADFSGLNIVVSDSVQGSVTLRLQNVPWDQALDIVMTTKGLDMRRNGNVMIVAPAEEIAAREQAELEALQALQTLEPLRAEFIQVNYGKASEFAQLMRGEGENSLLSTRGSVSVDERTNTLLVNDVASSLANIRRLVTTLDIPVRQVLIESRVVIVNDDYSRELGVRFGTTAVDDNSNNGLIGLSGTASGANSMLGVPTIGGAGGAITPVPVPPAGAQRYNVNLPVASPAGSIALAILGADYLVDLELSALQAEGDGRVISTPRIVATNQREARILQGTEIPYQEAASSGATTVSFKEAVLSLTVTPQITPDNKVIMDLTVTKDSVGAFIDLVGGGRIPTIDTRELVTQVVVDDGETVVLGGIYETELINSETRVPGLGNIPGLGHLFRSRNNRQNNAELLIFVTPKVLRDGARLE
jgi:type IV pilus assembly protein PilQ